MSVYYPCLDMIACSNLIALKQFGLLAAACSSLSPSQHILQKIAKAHDKPHGSAFAKPDPSDQLTAALASLYCMKYKNKGNIRITLYRCMRW